MIQLHWEWIPLIITIIFAILGYIFEYDCDFGVFKTLTGISALFSICLYSVMGTIWIIENIKVI